MPLTLLLADAPGDFFGSLMAVSCCLIIPGVFMTVFWLWMLIEILTQETSEGNEKLIWFLVVFFFHFIGALFYYFVRRPERKRRNPR